jgi:heat-stable enterotoxin receptor
MITSINEIIVKGLFFALIIYKDYVITMYKHDVTYEDLKVFSSFNSMIPESKNFLLKDLKRAIDNILSDKNVIQKSTVSMSERVYCRHFSNNFIKRILQFNSVHVEEVFIMFSDIVEYSVMCKTTKPADIVHLLDTLYQKYDKALDQFQQLQKIESIGDCYFVTSLLDKQEGNRDDTVETMSSIIKFANTTLKIANNIDVSIRIGIHVGHVSVGIIGTDIPRFAVVGNDVNIAARLESTCLVNSIQISKAVHDMIVILDQDVPIKSRNIVDAKNIGKVVAFTLG